MAKISEKKINLMQRLYREELAIPKIAEIAHVSRSTAYFYTILKEKGYLSQREYLEYRLKKRGFKSINEYDKYLNMHKQQKRKYIRLSNLIKRELKNKKKTQSWLASRINCSRQTVFLYTQGKIYPKQNMLRRICYALGLENRII